MYLFTNPD